MCDSVKQGARINLISFLPTPSQPSSMSVRRTDCDTEVAEELMLIAWPLLTPATKYAYICG
jgi:hypothetical protein